MSTLRERTLNRFRKSLNGEPLDAHAVFNFYTYPFFRNASSVDLNDYFNKPNVMMETQLEVFKKIENCGNIMPDFGVVAETSALGGEVKFDKNGFISVHPRNDIETLEDVLRLKAGDVTSDNYMKKAIEHLDYMVKNCPEGMNVNAHPIMGAFTIAAQLRGISDFCADTITDPEMAKALIDLAVQTQINFIKAQEKVFGKPLKHVLVCDDLSAFLNPEMFEEFILPTYATLANTFKDTEIWLHNDATTNHALNEISTMDIKTWQYGTCLMPLDAVTGIKNNFSVMGGIDPVLLATATKEETIKLCEDALISSSRNPRCIIGTSGTINEVPPENLLIILKMVDEYKIS